MSNSLYVVTSRQKVHTRECSYAQRIAFPLAWSPEGRLSGDRACSRCLTGGLPEAPIKQDRETEHWTTVPANEDQPWPCTIVDGEGRSLLGVHNGTPIVRSADLAARIVASLNSVGPATKAGR